MKQQQVDKLAFVAPERRATVARRIEILEEYNKLDTATVADADRAATAIGMTRISFYRLLRTWNANRDPERLDPVAGPKRPTGRKPHPGDAFVERMLGDLPPGRSIYNDVEAIETAAAEAGVELRPKHGLRQLVRDIRASDPRSVLPAHFIDHVALHLPIASQEGPVMPLASVLASAPGHIHAIALTMEAVGAPTVAKLITHAIERGGLVQDRRAGRNSLHIEGGFSQDWKELFATLRDHGIDRTGDNWRVNPGGRVGRTLVHPRLFGIKSHPKFITRGPENRPIKVLELVNETLSLEEAQAAMDTRTAAYDVEPLRIPGDVQSLLQTLKGFNRAQI